MSKPGGCHSSGISLGDALRLPKRHPAWRRREAQSGLGRNSLAQVMPQTPGGTAISVRHAYAVAASGLISTA